jgi:hypothetical protein
LAQVVLVHQLQVEFREPKALIQFLQPLHLKVVVAAVVLLTLLAPQLLVVQVVVHLAGQQTQLVQTEQQFKEQKAETEHIQILIMVLVAVAVLVLVALTELLQQVVTVEQELHLLSLVHQ